MKETELVRRLKAGDREAFDGLYGLYKDQAFRTAWFLAGNRADAEDIVQDAFVKAYVNIGQLKDEEGFRSWFYRILTRTAWRQSEGRRKEFPDGEILAHADAAGEQEDCAPEQIVRKEEAKRVRAVLNSLDEKHRTVLILYYYNEFSTKAIARIMGCMEGTVKSRLFTARKKMKAELERKYGREGVVYE